MGIDTGCMLIVGLPAEELEAGVTGELKEKLEKEGFYDAFSEDGGIGLESASPFFDAGYDDRIWGIGLAAGSWVAKEIDIAALPQQVAEARAKFKKLTGLEGRLFISAHVT